MAARAETPKVGRRKTAERGSIPMLKLASGRLHGRRSATGLAPTSDGTAAAAPSAHPRIAPPGPTHFESRPPESAHAAIPLTARRMIAARNRKIGGTPRLREKAGRCLAGCLGARKKEGGDAIGERIP